MSLTDSQFYTDIEKIKSLLKKNSLLNSSDFCRRKIRNTYRISNYDLLNHYKEIVENNDYSFILCDNSLLLFEKSDEENTLRYSFIEFPILFDSYEEFLSEKGLNFEEVGYSYVQEYNQLVSEADLKKYPQYFRYDYSEREYHELCHSVSHLHVGLSGSTRISISKKLSPLAFILIIIKNVYYSKWKDVVESGDLDSALDNMKSNCPDLDRSLFTVKDKKEFFLG